MLKASFIICLLSLISRHSLAQSVLNIRGKVEDSTGVAVANATVLIIYAKDSFAVITKNDGKFEFLIPQTEVFDLHVTIKGYLQYKKKYTPDSKKQSFELSPIILHTEYRELDPVIVARVRPILIGQDTITYNTAAFPTRPGSELEDILRRLPGIEVDMNGTVIFEGKKITKAMVNGKLFFGGDVLKAIRNLPANIIEKIQVVDDYGDKARLTGVKSSEPSKILNIQLKNDKNTGVFGQAILGKGNEGKYVGDITGNYFSGERQFSIGTGLSDYSTTGKEAQSHIDASYNDLWHDKWKIESVFNYNQDAPQSKNNLVQDNFYSSGQTHSEQTSFNNNDNHTLTLGTTLTYTPDAFHLLRIIPNLSIQRSRQSTLADFFIVEQDSGALKKSQGSNLDNIDNNAYALDIRTHYELTSINSRLKLVTELSAQYGKNKQEINTTLNSSIDFNDQKTLLQLQYIVKGSNADWNLNGSSSLIYDLGDPGVLELGFAWDQSHSTYNRNTYFQDSLHILPILIDSLSQGYFYLPTSQKLHLGYNIRLKKINLSAGTDAQLGKLSGKESDKTNLINYTYLNFVPSLQAAYTLTKTKLLYFQYSGNPTLPSLHQIQPIVDLSNPQYPTVGNPNLHPAYFQSLNLQYEQNNLRATQYVGFKANISYSSIRNAILPNIVHSKDSSAIIQRTEFMNRDGIYSLAAKYYLMLPAFAHKNLRISLNGAVEQNHLITIIDSLPNPTINTVATQSVHIQYLKTDILESDLSGTYSFSNTKYLSGSRADAAYSLGWALNNKHYFWHQLVLSYQLSQSMSNIPGTGLKMNPVSLSSSLQLQFLKNNKAAIGISGINLLNNSSTISQSLSATSITQSQTFFTNRFILLSFTLKFNAFKK